MGGGSSSATPTTPPGYTGGSVMDYTAPTYSPSPVANTGLFGLDQSQWGGVGRGIGGGFQSYGQGLASGGGSSSSAQAPQFSETPIPESSIPYSLIPQSGSGNEIVQLLQRLGIM